MPRHGFLKEGVANSCRAGPGRGLRRRRDDVRSALDTLPHRAGRPSLPRLCRSQLKVGRRDGAYHRDRPARREQRRPPRARSTRSCPSGRQGPDPRIKWAVLLLTLSIYYRHAVPSLGSWPRRAGSGAPAPFAERTALRLLRRDLAARTLLVTGLLVLASTILILTNALAGRLWCGFACPQTVWTDLFLLVER